MCRSISENFDQLKLARLPVNIISLIDISDGISRSLKKSSAILISLTRTLSDSLLPSHISVFNESLILKLFNTSFGTVISLCMFA